MNKKIKYKMMMNLNNLKMKERLEFENKKVNLCK